MNQCKEDVCYVSTQFDKEMKLTRYARSCADRQINYLPNALIPWTKNEKY